ncbi:PEP/pyruvate-binding domain-containing protein [Cellulomonas fengjieae]|uniref:Pyruvate, phosphate dikinase n=1 Tax=Cellulomonas fengjieae TaxID=2819978 RepID=A0ABS3SKS6_9CELL|nr:PEP/pyruvate-binding domain-containing protein [Cellulomonas fengjieae]MBO3086267.1 pyruvate, phosphate dikinase [Cellulomonas fengjieae]QVI65689.1 pyruvate, phosphate dikinase [Cellulomonas fengjieae]
MLVPLRDADVAACGGKAGALGRLARAGLPVPDGFVVPFAAYRTDLDLRPGLSDALARELAALGDPPVAVRSSAGDEDTALASAAGQHETVLGVRGVDQVADAVRACWASLHSPTALAYRAATPHRPADPVMAVLVQRLVDAEVSGVMFTPAGSDGVTRIEASWGLGTSVVGGTVTPDAYRVEPGGTVRRRIADKRTRVDRAGTRVVTSEVAELDRGRPALDEATALRLADLGRRVGTVLGGALDIEWAVVDGELWVLQARPVTADLPAPAPPTLALLTGTPGSRGSATGTARIVRGPGDFTRTRAGDILVCPWTDPGWTPLLRLVAGVVTETGGALSHAAIVARERGIPAVLGVPGATTTLRDGTTITIDGDAGTVTSNHP